LKETKKKHLSQKVTKSWSSTYPKGRDFGG